MLVPTKAIPCLLKTSVRKTSSNNQKAAVRLRGIPSFRARNSEECLILQTYKKYIVSKEYCIAHHDDKACLQPNCRYHSKITGDIEEML